MKTFILLITFGLPVILFSQVPARFEYPDTLWVYGKSTDTAYGRTSEKPIKVGGGILPKHVYRYLNSLIDTNGVEVLYERLGSYRNPATDRKTPLTAFKVSCGDTSFNVFFDQYEWEKPELITEFNWQERRSGYHGEFENDTVYHGYGLYFFSNGGYYKGKWAHGLMNGQGEMSIPNGEKYVGEFKDGMYHGTGTLFYVDGGKYEGEWRVDKKQGKGKIYYPPGSDIAYIEGNFEDNNPKGTFRVVKSDESEETHDFEK